MTNESIEELAGSIFDQPLVDITVAGFTTTDAPASQFKPIFLNVYLHLGPSLVIRFSSVNQYSLLAVNRVTSRSYTFELPEGSQYAYSSVAKLRQREPHSTPPVQGFRFISTDKSLAQNGIVRCAGLLLDGDDFLFLDPANLFGVRIGSDREYADWVCEFGKREPLREILLYRDGSRSERQLS